MFEHTGAVVRKVSFEREGLDASKACHISAREVCAAVLQRVEAPSQKREDCGCVINQRHVECLKIK